MFSQLALSSFVPLLATAGAEGDGMGTLIPLLIMFVPLIVFYFILSRSQKKRDKGVRDMQKAIAVGDEITTIGGIKGKVINAKDDEITIETGPDRTKIRFERNAVQRKEEKEEA